jgi:hypothetical protein
LPKVGNPTVRVWEEVWAVYREVAKKHGLKLSDLVSIVLLYAPIFSPAALILGLEDNYEDVDRSEAIDIVADLKNGLENMVSIAIEAQEASEKAQAEEKEGRVLVSG